MNTLKSALSDSHQNWVSRERYERERLAREDVEALLNERTRALHEAREALEVALARERRILRLQNQFIRIAGRELDALMLSIDATSARIARNTKEQNTNWIRHKCISIQQTVTRSRVIIERTLNMAYEQQMTEE